MRTDESGFIAIISVTIVAALLMAVSFALSASGFFARSDIADSEYKERSTALAEACIEDALVKLAADPAYLGNETLTIGTEHCTIMTIPSGSPKIIKTTAILQSSVSNIAVSVDPLDLSIISWEEVATF
jgi:hypothetical protein